MNGVLDYKKILDNLDEPVVLCDDSGIVVYSNNTFSNLFSNAGGKNISSFFEKISQRGYKYFSKELDGYKLYTIKHEDNPQEAYSEFISTVSHELRTPLTSIRGFADTMLFSFEKLDSAQIQKFLSIIKEQSNRLIKLIENLLAVSKLQNTKETLVYKAIELSGFMEKILLLMKNRYKDHTFVFTPAKNLMPVLADENKLQQILINLLDNAAKYSQEGSVVEISAKLSADTSDVEIIIKDSGVGIPEEQLERIFDKFARVEGHLTRKTEGSGLGLYIVKNLVENMNGKISVFSKPFEGSTFTVSLCAADYTAQSGKKILENG